MAKVFLDTSYTLALSFRSDSFHPRATQLAKWLDRERVSIVTTRAVLLEIGNALSKERYRYQAVNLLNSIEEEDTIDIVSVSDGLYTRALTLFQSRPDKEWGLVDCMSCVVMQEQEIEQALTADRHFQQMGFRALLREA